MTNSESPGPFRADQLRPGDPYELSNGHLVPCLPAGGRGGKAANVGGGVLASDPAVQDVGLDVGFSPSPETLRAPDVAVGEIPDQPGWVQGVPLLAVEYADTGKDEEDLQIKIRELLSAGTRYFWVVRLTGTPRVETHQPGEAVHTSHPGEQLMHRESSPIRSRWKPSTIVRQPAGWSSAISFSAKATPASKRSVPKAEIVTALREATSQ
jgi:Uma2 family endonuclease